jgi:hypothetical protein
MITHLKYFRIISIVPYQNVIVKTKKTKLLLFIKNIVEQSSRKSLVLTAKISLGPPFEHLASDPLSDCSFQEKNVCYGPLRDCGMLSDFVKCRTTKSFEGPAEICLSVLCLTEKLKVSWTLVGAILLNVGGSGGGGTQGIWQGTTLSN